MRRCVLRTCEAKAATREVPAAGDVFAPHEGSRPAKPETWREELYALGKAAGYSKADVDLAVERLSRLDRVTINFDPARVVKRGGKEISVIEALTEDTAYRNGCEVGISGNESSAADAEQIRARCRQQEVMLFGYDPKFEDAEHPIYAGLDLFNRPEGSSPRYGSCYIVLEPDVLKRSTIDPASGLGPAVPIGAPERMLVEPGFVATPPAAQRARLFDLLLERVPLKPDRSGEESYGALEVEVFGPIEWKSDVRAVVGDARLQGTEQEAKLRAFSRKTGIALYWYRGSKVVPDRS